MDHWYILPNGNVKHTEGLEIQPENDWFPTEQSLDRFTQAQRDAGKSDVQIIQIVMRLSLQGEAWLNENLS